MGCETTNTGYASQGTCLDSSRSHASLVTIGVSGAVEMTYLYLYELPR